MKKTRFLALVLVVAIMMMGAGYAYWKEELQINTTVKTGDLDFKFNKAKVVMSEDTVQHSKAKGNAVMYEHYPHYLEVDLENLYPGAEFTIDFTLKNTGDMDAKVNNFTFNAGNWELNDNLLLTEATIGTQKSGPLLDPIPLKDLNTQSLANKEYIDAPILRNKEIRISFTFKVNEDADKSNFGENATYSFNIKADVLQYNDNAN